MKALAPPPGREAGGLEGPPRNCEGADPADLAVFVSEIFFMVGLALVSSLRCRTLLVLLIC